MNDYIKREDAIKAVCGLCFCQIIRAVSAAVTHIRRIAAY